MKNKDKPESPTGPLSLKKQHWFDELSLKINKEIAIKYCSKFANFRPTKLKGFQVPLTSFTIQNLYRDNPCIFELIGVKDEDIQVLLELTVTKVIKTK